MKDHKIFKKLLSGLDYLLFCNKISCTHDDESKTSRFFKKEIIERISTECQNYKSI